MTMWTDHFATTTTHTLKSDKPEPAQVEIVRRVETWLSELFLVALLGFTAMLLLGSLHSDYPAVPAVSYWNAVCGVWLIGIVGQATRPSQRVWSKRGKR